MEKTKYKSQERAENYRKLSSTVRSTFSKIEDIIHDSILKGECSGSMTSNNLSSSIKVLSCPLADSSSSKLSSSIKELNTRCNKSFAEMVQDYRKKQHEKMHSMINSNSRRITGVSVHPQADRLSSKPSSSTRV